MTSSKALKREDEMTYGIWCKYAGRKRPPVPPSEFWVIGQTGEPESYPTKEEAEVRAAQGNRGGGNEYHYEVRQLSRYTVERLVPLPSQRR